MIKLFNFLKKYFSCDFLLRRSSSFKGLLRPFLERLKAPDLGKMGLRVR